LSFQAEHHQCPLVLCTNTASGLDVTSGVDVAPGNELDSAELLPFQSLSYQIYHDSDSDMDDNDYLDNNKHLRAYQAHYAKYQRQCNEAQQQ
jgi:hypothetical protein